MTGSNPSIATTRLAERQQITGLNTSTIKRTQPTSPWHNGVHERHTIGSIGKTRVDLNSNYSSQILFKSRLFFALIRTEHKVELHHKF